MRGLSEWLDRVSLKNDPYASYPMVTANLKIQWPDGEMTHAFLQSESPEASAPVHYSGPVDRVADAPCDTDLAFLQFVMKRAAEQGNGRYEETIEGRYDSWAE